MSSSASGHLGLKQPPSPPQPLPLFLPNETTTKNTFFLVVVDIVSICRNNRNERRRAWNGSNFIITIISSPLGFLRLLTSTAGLKIRGRNTHTQNNNSQVLSFSFFPGSFPPHSPPLPVSSCMFSEHVCGSALARNCSSCPSQ